MSPALLRELAHLALTEAAEEPDDYRRNDLLDQAEACIEEAMRLEDEDDELLLEIRREVMMTVRSACG